MGGAEGVALRELGEGAQTGGEGPAVVQEVVMVEIVHGLLCRLVLVQGIAGDFHIVAMV